jgi:hypothetical protein
MGVGIGTLNMDESSLGLAGVQKGWDTMLISTATVFLVVVLLQ